MKAPRLPARALVCACLLATIGVSFGTRAAQAGDAFLAVEWVTPAQLHPGSLVEATVLTSVDVGYVELRVRTWSINLEKVAPGKFRLHYRVPLLPPMALGDWSIDLIAHSPAGNAAKRIYHVTYRYF